MTHTRENWHWRDGPSSGPAVIFDIDGVLADAAGRQHFLDWGDWRRFFEACGDDPVVEEIERLLELLDGGLTIVLLTGRPRRVQPHTLAWLERYGLRWDLLIMREHGDYAGVDQFKRATLADIRGGDVFENARIVRQVLAGEGGPREDMVALNAAVNRT